MNPRFRTHLARRPSYSEGGEEENYLLLEDGTPLLLEDGTPLELG